MAEAGTRLAEAEVWMGAAPRVGLVLPEDLSILIPATGQDALQAHISYQGPIEAPIAKGQEIAELVLEREDMPEMRLPLVAEADVPRGGFVPHVVTAAQVLMGKAGLGLTGLNVPGLGGGGATDAAAPADEGQDAAAPVEDGSATAGDQAATSDGSASEDTSSTDASAAASSGDAPADEAPASGETLND